MIKKIEKEFFRLSLDTETKEKVLKKEKIDFDKMASENFLFVKRTIDDKKTFITMFKLKIKNRKLIKMLKSQNIKCQINERS